MNTQQRREFLDSKLKTGRMVRVCWKKKDGTPTEKTVRLWAEKGLASGDRNVVQVNTTAHKPELYSCYEVQGENSKWCNITLPNLVWVKAEGEVVEFS